MQQETKYTNAPYTALKTLEFTPQSLTSSLLSSVGFMLFQEHIQAPTSSTILDPKPRAENSNKCGCKTGSASTCNPPMRCDKMGDKIPVVRQCTKGMQCILVDSTDSVAYNLGLIFAHKKKVNQR